MKFNELYKKISEGSTPPRDLQVLAQVRSEIKQIAKNYQNKRQEMGEEAWVKILTLLKDLKGIYYHYDNE